MKKFLLFPILAFMAAFIVPACSDDKDEIFPPETGDSINNGNNAGDTIVINDTNIFPSKTFYGTLVVNESYVQDSVNCKINFDKKNLTLYMFNVKFAQTMPMSITLSVPGIPFEGSVKNLKFSADSIVPMMGVAPVPQFMFEQIDGVMQHHLLNFSAEISGRGTITFSGIEPNIW